MIAALALETCNGIMSDPCLGFFFFLSWAPVELPGILFIHKLCRATKKEGIHHSVYSLLQKKQTITQRISARFISRQTVMLYWTFHRF